MVFTTGLSATSCPNSALSAVTSGYHIKAARELADLSLYSISFDFGAGGLLRLRMIELFSLLSVGLTNLPWKHIH